MGEFLSNAQKRNTVGESLSIIVVMSECKTQKKIFANRTHEASGHDAHTRVTTYISHIKTNKYTLV